MSAAGRRRTTRRASWHIAMTSYRASKLATLPRWQPLRKLSCCQREVL